MLRSLRVNPRTRRNPDSTGWTLAEFHGIPGGYGKEDIYTLTPSPYWGFSVYTGRNYPIPLLSMDTQYGPLFVEVTVHHEKYTSGPYADRFIGRGSIRASRMPEIGSMEPVSVPVMGDNLEDVMARTEQQLQYFARAVRQEF